MSLCVFICQLLFQKIYHILCLNDCEFNFWGSVHYLLVSGNRLDSKSWWYPPKILRFKDKDEAGRKQLTYVELSLNQKL